MRSKRVPDRVHVVRPPEQDSYGRPAAGGQNVEIVRMLAQISDKLKRSEAERYELLSELREYRKSLKELEEKSQTTEKAYRTLETRLKTQGSVDTESVQRQTRFEKSLKATEDKLVKAIAGQALIDKRLKDTEDKQTVIDQRLDQSIAEQTRIDRQLEITAQDKSRLVRKLERLEEMVTDTRDALQSKAMVLLTDQSTAAQAALKAPAWGKGSPEADIADHHDAGWSSRFFNMQAVGMASMIIAALLAGWAINQMQQPKVPQIAVLENGGLAKLNLEENRWEPVVQGGEVLPSAKLSDINNLEQQKLTQRLAVEPAASEAEEAETTTDAAQPQTPADVTATQASIVPDEKPADVLDYSDEQLLQALEENPEELATQLNDIEPMAAPADEPVQEATNSVLDDPQITAPMKNFDKVAFKQDENIRQAVMSEKNNAPLAEQISPDNTLPDVVKNIETQAFAGNPEAQHDLAAIYTAGHGGVDQNFERAAFWFRQAADNEIANARYNLGVLYHQGLGQERNLDRALYWYREAAKLGHAEAQYNLGIAHIEGIGTDYDPRLAAAFFERAANSGIMEAAYNLGLIYENGLLGEAKPDEALLWYKIAADQGSPDAKSAMQQLANNLQIDMNDVNRLVERMQQINMSVKGRRAGPEQGSAARTSSVNPQQAIIAQVQEYLMLTGAYAGPADGINGPNTEKAVRAYQAANDLEVNGQITQSLLNHMVSGAVERINNNE
jgi:TPR repeat protein